ncbi:MAG: hypothetical protein WA395_15605 [Nitrososphaeraceae archaeon]
MRFSGLRAAKRGGSGGVDVVFERISRAIKIFLAFPMILRFHCGF